MKHELKAPLQGMFQMWAISAGHAIRPRNMTQNQMTIRYTEMLTIPFRRATNAFSTARQFMGMHR
jgi:hypothetical protein